VSPSPSESQFAAWEPKKELEKGFEPCREPPDQLQKTL
jgi:hypothetical protein